MCYNNNRHWQCYTLNLFKFYRNQKQTPFCFLLSNLAKSPRLPSISNLLSKLAIVFAPLLLLPYSVSSQALLARTSQVINGSAPYLTLDGGVTKLTTTDDLISIKLSDGQVLTPQNNNSVMTPIHLPNAGDTLANIEMIVPSSSDSININDLVTQGKWGDDDADGQGAHSVTATGNISVSFTDKNSNAVSRSDILDICNAPYRITLSSTDATLETKYGVPNRSTLNGNTVSYYINPNSQQPKVCYVRPRLIFGGTNFAGDNPRFAGPSSIWDPTKGFLTQSINPSSYSLNFPTTGADGLYFDLDIGGVDASQLTWSSKTYGGITATVNWVKPRSDSFTIPCRWCTGTTTYDDWITDKSKNVTRVTLNGPRANNIQIQSSNPSRLTVPSLPQLFVLEGKNSSGVVVKYGFELKQWFVHRGEKYTTVPEQATWCSSLGYRFSKIRDLSNAKCGVDNAYFPCISDIDGSTPSSGSLYYQRQIGAGFLSEWSDLSYYGDVAGFGRGDIWTNDAVSNTTHLYIHRNGYVDQWGTSGGGYAVCTVP
ncbi:MAG: hypothetical protein J6572_02120 [Gilliamella sp.]|nr:hypothetical protein [Gilliamella sp.]